MFHEDLDSNGVNDKYGWHYNLDTLSTYHSDPLSFIAEHNKLA